MGSTAAATLPGTRGEGSKLSKLACVLPEVSVQFSWVIHSYITASPRITWSLVYLRQHIISILLSLDSYLTFLYLLLSAIPLSFTNSNKYKPV